MTAGIGPVEKHKLDYIDFTLPVKDIQKVINKAPNSFKIVAAYPGFFGSLVYRCIAGSSDSFVWDKSFCGVDEDLKPLEWPKLTEGFDIYNVENRLNHFKENHFTTAHISIKLLEKFDNLRQLLEFYDKDKTLLIRTHRMDIHEFFDCDIVRIVGSLENIVPNYSNTRFRHNGNKIINTVVQPNVHNLNIDRFMHKDFDIFIEEYLSLCAFLNILPNINNVRSFMLLQKEKLDRFYNDSLPK